MTTESTQNPTILQFGILIASAVALVGSVGSFGVALAGTETVLWATAGFGVIAALASLIGVLCGLGKFRDSLGMATLCVGGALLMCAGFSTIDLRPNLGANPGLARLVLPWAGLMAACAATVVGLGAIGVLNRRRASWRELAKGIAFLVPALALLVGGFLVWRTIPHEDGGRVLALGLLLVGGSVIGVLGSIGGHLVIRAFELVADDPASPK